MKVDLRGVIYDCDGVIFDSLDSNRKLYNDICTGVGRPPMAKDELHFVHTHTLAEAIHHLFRYNPEQEKAALELWKRIDISRYISYLRMEPNLLSTLEVLKQRRIIRAICTSRSTTMKFIMEKFQLWPHFDMVVTALDVTNPKPHPEALDKIIATFQLDRRKTIMVGDSPNDRLAAEAAGIIFVAYKNRDIASDFFINDHLALLNYIEGNAKSIMNKEDKI